MKTIRSFLALRLDLNTVRAVADAQKELKQSLDGSGLKVAWVPPPNMHITIRFLGDVTEPMIYAIEDMLTPLVKRTQAFGVSAGSIGVFPDPEHPRILWAGVRSDENQLHSFYESISKALIEAGFPTEQRAFRSHLTIGRVKGGDTQALAETIEPFRDHTFGTTVIRDLICYRSDLMPRGAEYHKLWTIPLAPPIQHRRSSPPPRPSQDPPPADDIQPPLAAPEPELEDEPSDAAAPTQASNESSSPTETDGETSAAPKDSNPTGE